MTDDRLNAISNDLAQVLEKHQASTLESIQALAIMTAFIQSQATKSYLKLLKV